MKALAAGVCVAVLLLATSTAGARLTQGTAYFVALKDAQAKASELGVGSGSVSGCKRRSSRRFNCGASATASDYVVAPYGEDNYYLHKRCTWTVVATEQRSYVKVRRKGMRCRSWHSESPIS